MHIRSLIVGFVLGAITIGMFWLCPSPYPHHDVVTQTVTVTNSTDSFPVYKLVSRMDFAISNPASTAYVFERGGICEYVQAQYVRPLTPRAEFKLTGYYVKVLDGTFYPLETESK